jgi:small basic protein
MKNQRKKCLKKFYLSFFFRFLLEEYLTIILCVMINFYAIEFKGKSMEFGSTITTLVLGLLTLLVFPITVTKVLKKYQMKYESKNFEKVYGTLKEGLVSQNPNKLLIFNVSFLVRRLLTAIIIVILRDHPGLQPPLLLILSTLSLALMFKYQFYSEKSQYNIEIFNELCVWLCSLSFFLMTDYVERYQFRETAGWILVCTTLASVAVNLLCCLGFTIYEIAKRINAWCRNRKEKIVKI